MIDEIKDKYFLALPKETIEISELCYRELATKGVEAFNVLEEKGYFWNSYILELKQICMS